MSSKILCQFRGTDDTSQRSALYRYGNKINRALSLAKAIKSPSRSLVHVRCVQDNLGDILVAQAIESLLEPLVVFSGMPGGFFNRLDRTIGIQRIFTHSCLGGGTLILAPHGIGWLEAVQYFCAKTNPLCTFGTGVIDPEFRSHISALNADSFNIDSRSIEEWLRCLSKFQYVTVRGVESKRILEELKLEKEITVIGDPALYYAASTISLKSKRKRIGINISTCLESWGNSQEHLLREIKGFLAYLANAGWDVTFFPTERADQELAERISRDNGGIINVCNVYLDPHEYIARVQEQDIFVGTKLHSVICAFCSYTPSIMIGYQPKCYDFMKTMEFDDYHIRSDRLTEGNLITLVEELYANIDQVQRLQFDMCQRYRDKLIDFRDVILSSLGIVNPA